MNCQYCNNPLRIGDWPVCPDHSRGHGRIGQPPAHTRERIILYKHPLTGEILYPGRTDCPMPPQFAAQGYETWEPSVEDIRRLERETGVVNQTLNYNNGNSTDAAAMATPEPLPSMEGIEIVPVADSAANRARLEAANPTTTIV